MRLRIFILIIFITLCLLPLLANAATYNWYFSNDAAGNDSAGDGSIEKPWKTLSKAQTEINNANSNDTCNLYFDRGDTWSANTGAAVKTIIFGLLIDSSDPIVNIDAYGSGDKPCFDGQVTDFSSASEHNQSKGPLHWSQMFGFEREDCSVKNIEIKEVYGNAITIKNADNFVLEGCSIHHFGSAGINGAMASIIDNIIVRNNEFYVGQQLWRYSLVHGWGAAIQLISADYQPNNNLVQYNVVYDIYGEGINAPNSIVEYNIVGDTASTAINTSSHRWNSTTTIVRYNLVTMSDWSSSVYDGMHGGGSSPTGIRVFDERDTGNNTSATIEIYGNIIINRSHGIWMFADRNEPYGTIKVYNNTIIDCYTTNMRISQTDELAVAAYVYNNSSIIYDRIGVAPYQGAATSDFSTFTIENNHAWIKGGLVITDINFRFRTNLCIGDPKLPGEDVYGIDWDGQRGAMYFSNIDFNTHLYPSADSGLVNTGKTLGADYETKFLHYGTNFSTLPDIATFQRVSQSDAPNWSIGAIVHGSGTSISSPIGLEFKP